MKKIIIFLLIVGVIGAFLPTKSFAQSSPALENKVNLLFGLNQVLASGFNVEGNVFYKRFAFDYSHGVSLDFAGPALSSEMNEQKLVVHLPYTTGFGLGYRFNEAFNIRIEPKWHRFELYYEGDAQNSSTRIVAYNTFTLGLGAYYNWKPFKQKNNFLNHIMVVPSVRYWPRLSSSLKGDIYTYQNRETGELETHQAMEVGFANTPWIVNISVGYSFSKRKKG